MKSFDELDEVGSVTPEYFDTTVQTTSTPLSPDKLLAEALSGKSEAFKRRVLNFALSSGLSQDDPLFLVLVATGQLEAMLVDAPDTLELLFKNWSRDLARNLELVEEVARLATKNSDRS